MTKWLRRVIDGVSVMLTICAIVDTYMFLTGRYSKPWGITAFNVILLQWMKRQW